MHPITEWWTSEGKGLTTMQNCRGAIILVDHGSRLSEANQVLEEIALRLQKQLPDYYVQTAHMELAEPSIEQAFARCDQRDIESVIVFPYFLGPGLHSSQDIPELCREAAEKYPGITYKVVQPLGVHDKIVDIIRERMGI